eukprot:TRINITY_DN70_c0_g1_i7.p1 TRINITY_DN70_c0_g1~~TRINITY_DN70_c0_g1_i7.p1  ORF type:complete len:109 (-),score=28.58 TRINITY_DN70_c0_g1_i7:228-554(-)
MVGGTSGGNWKRPVNRMYSYNYQVGENYYLPMTSYLESKNSGAISDLPGPLCFSERIAEYPLCGKSSVVTSTCSSTHTSETPSPPPPASPACERRRSGQVSTRLPPPT